MADFRFYRKNGHLSKYGVKCSLLTLRNHVLFCINDVHRYYPEVCESLRLLANEINSLKLV